MMLDGVFYFLFRTLPLSLFNLTRLMLFVLVLFFPGFFRFAWYYFVVSDRVSVPYSDESIRQRLDVYRTYQAVFAAQSCTPDQQQQQQQQQQREPLLNTATSSDRQNSVHGNGNDNNGEYHRDTFEDEEEVPLQKQQQQQVCQSTNNNTDGAPVLIFCTGGGWMIGYKMWGALLARALTATGIVVVIPDMQNYPLVYIPDMVQDVNLAIDWTFQNIANYGGDPNNIVLVGQSAGGHVSMMAVLTKIQRIMMAKKDTTISNKSDSDETNNDNDNDNDDDNGIDKSDGEEDREKADVGTMAKADEEDKKSTTAWIPTDLKGFVAISSPLNLQAMLPESFSRLGFDTGFVDRMFGFERDEYDPYFKVQQLLSTEQHDIFFDELPPNIQIIHGTIDQTVPHEVSESFYQQLLNHSTDDRYLSFVSYKGWSHTDPILEGPFDADHRFHKQLFDNVQNWTTTDPSGLIWPNDPLINDRLCPHFMVQAARYFNPF
mmetsp:Transcript_1776/g.2075  ORF Transcript_1776/g.2075 Transcript_1776/m.2075 type:complete len:488 (-) Transcript_1776:120-1583(-)